MTSSCWPPRLYALADIEAALLPDLLPDNDRSALRNVVEAVMLRRPGNWERYYHGDARTMRVLRTYSYSDRVRYYWADPEIDAAARKLLSNLANVTIPENLLGQFLPTQYWEVRRGAIDGSSESIVRSKVRDVIRSYAKACGAE